MVVVWWYSSVPWWYFHLVGLVWCGPVWPVSHPAPARVKVASISWPGKTLTGSCLGALQHNTPVYTWYIDTFVVLLESYNGLGLGGGLEGISIGGNYDFRCEFLTPNFFQLLCRCWHKKGISLKNMIFSPSLDVQHLAPIYYTYTCYIDPWLVKLISVFWCVARCGLWEHWEHLLVVSGNMMIYSQFQPVIISTAAAAASTEWTKLFWIKLAFYEGSNYLQSSTDSTSSWYHLNRNVTSS